MREDLVMFETKGGGGASSYNRRMGDGVLLVEAIVQVTNGAPVANAAQDRSANLANTLTFFSHILTTPFEASSGLEALAMFTYLDGWKSRNSEDSDDWLHTEGPLP